MIYRCLVCILFLVGFYLCLILYIFRNFILMFKENLIKLFLRVEEILYNILIIVFIKNILLFKNIFRV